MAALSNFYIDQGSDFSTTVSLTDSSGDKTRVLEGQAILTPGVSR